MEGLESSSPAKQLQWEQVSASDGGAKQSNPVVSNGCRLCKEAVNELAKGLNNKNNWSFKSTLPGSELLQVAQQIQMTVFSCFMR